MNGAFRRAKESASRAKCALQESELAGIAKQSSQKLVKKASEISQEQKIKKRATIVLTILQEFDWVKYNEDFFRARRNTRDGLLGVPKEAWTRVIGRRRRVLKRVEKSGSAAQAKGLETWRGFVPGAVLGGLGTAAVAGAIGVTAAPVVLVGGASVGALVIGVRAGIKADGVLESMKANEKAMAVVFDGIVASLASRYHSFEDEAIEVSSTGAFENEWGSLGADTVAARFGDMTLWASNHGIRIRVSAATIDVKSGGLKNEVLSRHLVYPSLVDFVIVNDLGRFPAKDVEAVVAMVTILSSPRGHKIRNHMSRASKVLMTSILGSPHIMFNQKKTEQHLNLMCVEGRLLALERDETGATFSRPCVHGDCLMPLELN